MSLKIEQDVQLKEFSNFKVGGPADFFVRAADIDDLKEALIFARERNLVVFILAAGTNLVISDEGFRGLVIQIAIDSWRFDGETLISGASTMMSQLVEASIENGLAGLEWAGGLPGTFGGAIFGNAGCFGAEIKDIIGSVTSVEIASGRKIVRSNKECRFIYRGSIFKKVEEVIVEASVRLKPGDKTKLRQIADGHISYRQARHPIEYPNAGSVFKNVAVEKIPLKIRSQFRDFIKTDPFPVVPAGKIIDDAGLKGYRLGDAQVSKKHCNYFINLGNAKAADIVALIRYTQKTVRNKFGIELELEQRLVGF